MVAWSASERHRPHFGVKNPSIAGAHVSTDPAEWRSHDTDDLLDTILALPDRTAAERFFRDLCTLRELHDLAQRWHVVRLLNEGRPYVEISRATGASTATVTRIAQWLHHGTGGYREALARSAAAPSVGRR
jgi:TrpR-related protein YerC/YecD